MQPTQNRSSDPERMSDEQFARWSALRVNEPNVQYWEARQAYAEALADAYELAERSQVEVTPADTLRGAALYVYRKGWHQRDMFDLSDPDVAFPPACGLGAIRMALVGSAEVGADTWPAETVEAFDRAVMAFADHLFTCYGEPDPTASAAGTDEMPWPEQIVADWNDAYDRNVSQVIAALNGAADQSDSRHGRPVCCGQPMLERAPSGWAFPNGSVAVDRVFDCLACDRREFVEVIDQSEPGGFPYCTGTFGGVMPCADAVGGDA